MAVQEPEVIELLRNKYGKSIVDLLMEEYRYDTDKFYVETCFNVTDHPKGMHQVETETRSHKEN